MIKNIENYGDILAIPFFIALSYYFVIKKNKTIFEYLLMAFAITGSIADIYFTYRFLLNFSLV